MHYLRIKNLHGMFLNEMECAVNDPNEIKCELNCGKVNQNETDNVPSNEINSSYAIFICSLKLSS
jgi:hypothetical protein